MERPGLLLFFGLGLIFLPAIFGLIEEADAPEQDAPVEISTQGADAARCQSDSVTIAGGARLGCNDTPAPRRIEANGALFIRP